MREVKIYLTPYQYTGILPVNKFWHRYDLKPNRSWYGFIQYGIHRIYSIYYIDRYKNSNIYEKTFSSLEKSQEVLDQKLIEEGYILLTEEQYEKMAILI